MVKPELFLKDIVVGQFPSVFPLVLTAEGGRATLKDKPHTYGRKAWGLFSYIINRKIPRKV